MEIPTVRQTLMIVIALIVIGLIFPLGLGMVSIAGDTLITLANGSQVALSTVVDPAVLTMLTVLLPILAVIGITIGFLPRAG